MVDYLVVGLGLSGLAVCEELQKRNLSFKVFENHSQKSSLVAAGLYNPVILKRFTPAWRADEHLESAIPFYKKIEEKLQLKLIYPGNIYRKFHNVEEQNNWFEATDKPRLSNFLSETIEKDLSPAIPAPFGYGKVLHTGSIATDTMLKEYRKNLKDNGVLTQESFDYKVLKIEGSGILYKGFHARKIVFCEGFGLAKNPFFDYLPLRPNKGEYLTIFAEKLKLEVIVKASVFVIPLGNDLYRVGATYNNRDTTPQPSESSKTYLLKKLQDIITCDFKVVDQVAGIRPATKDRKPLLGVHPKYSQLFCCNGFGSRGVLMGPEMAKNLIDFSEENKPLASEIDIKRFEKELLKK